MKGWLPPGSVCLAGGAGLMPPPSTAALLEVAPLDIRLTPPPPSPHAGGSPKVDSLAACQASAWGLPPTQPSPTMVMTARRVKLQT